MNHLIIAIDLTVSETQGKLTEHEAEEATKQAYKAARKAVCNFTAYNESDFAFKIEQ